MCFSDITNVNKYFTYVCFSGITNVNNCFRREFGHCVGLDLEVDAIWNNVKRKQARLC